MDSTTKDRFDRPDTNLVRAKTQTFVVVEENMRGALNLGKDRSQHRRFTSLFDDLQN